MRFREFVDNPVKNKLVTVLRTLRGRSASKETPAELSWPAINKMIGNMAIDYETFKSLYDNDPELFKNLIHNFDSDGVKLEVPGVSSKQPASDKEDSQDKVDDIAKSNAEKNLD